MPKCPFLQSVIMDSIVGLMNHLLEMPTHTDLVFTHFQRYYTCRILSYDYPLPNHAVKSKKLSALPCPVDAYLIDSFLCIFAEGSSFHPTMSALDHLSKIPHVETSEMNVT